MKLFNLCRSWLRRRRQPEFVGATVGYARELHQLAAEPGWLSPEEQVSVQTAQAAIDRDIATLDAIESFTRGYLESMWARVTRELGLDDLDREWAELATGELVPA